MALDSSFLVEKKKINKKFSLLECCTEQELNRRYDGSFSGILPFDCYRHWILALARCWPIYRHFMVNEEVRSFGAMRIRIIDPTSPESWCIKATDEFVIRVDSSVPLMHHDPSDLVSLIWIRITPKERSQNLLRTRITRVHQSLLMAPYVNESVGPLTNNITGSHPSQAIDGKCLNYSGHQPKRTLVSPEKGPQFKTKHLM